MGRVHYQRDYPVQFRYFHYNMTPELSLQFTAYLTKIDSFWNIDIAAETCYGLSRLQKEEKGGQGLKTSMLPLKRSPSL